MLQAFIYMYSFIFFVFVWIPTFQPRWLVFFFICHNTCFHSLLLTLLRMHSPCICQKSFCLSWASIPTSLLLCLMLWAARLPDVFRTHTQTHRERRSEVKYLRVAKYAEFLIRLLVCCFNVNAVVWLLKSFRSGPKVI